MTGLCARRLSALLVAVGATLCIGMPVGARAVTTGPSVALDRYEMAPTERVVLTLDGFDAGSVVISVCGNDARRGSSDCNMIESEGLRLNRDGGETISSIPVAVPPAPCPCIIRVSSTSNDEVAVAAITLIGHPVAPVVGAPSVTDALAVSVTAHATPHGFAGWVRSSLGGAATYEVTIKVRNRSTVAVERVAVSATAGRDDENVLTSLALTDPGRIDPGQTWTAVVQAELPAPVYGSAEWRVNVSGVGPTVAATDSTRHTPVLLVVLVVVFLVDIALLGWRLLARRRRRVDRPEVDEIDDDGEWGRHDTTILDAVATDEDSAQRDPVSA